MPTGVDHENRSNLELVSPVADDSIFTESVAAEFNRAMSNHHMLMFQCPLGSMAEEIVLKPPNITNILEVSYDLRSALVLHSREAIATSIGCKILPSDASGSPEDSGNRESEGSEWLEQFFVCFDAAKEIGRVDVLYACFQIMKTMFVVCTPHVLVRLVEDDVYESVFNILKHDSEIPRESHIDHLALLKSKASFTQLHSDIPESIQHAIRKSFRLSYIKDSILARYLDDVSFVSFTAAVNSINSKIISYFIEHPVGFIESLMPSLSSPTDFAQALEFVQSILTASKTMTIDEKASIIVELCDGKFFDLLQPHIATRHSRDRIIEIVIALTSLNPQWIRDRCISTDLLTNLFTALHDVSNSEYQTSQIVDLFRLLLEPVPFADSFLTYFYEKDFLTLLSTYSPCTPHFTVQSVLDLISYCVISHSQAFKAYFPRCGSLGKTVRSILIAKDSLECPRMVQLAAIRLVRAFFWQKDPMFFRFLQAFNIPGLILQLLFLHRPDKLLIDGNMIYSSCLEIITFLCVNNQTNVIETLCRPETETERIVNQLAAEVEVKAHSELAQFMITTVERLRNPTAFPMPPDDMNSRQSITSSRGRSLSPTPLVVPIPRPRRESTTLEEEQDDNLTTFKRFRFSTDSP